MSAKTGGAATHLRVMAYELALQYHGAFPFMVDMHRRSRTPTSLPSVNQARAIVRCYKTHPQDFEPI